MTELKQLNITIDTKKVRCNECENGIFFTVRTACMECDCGSQFIRHDAGKQLVRGALFSRENFNKPNIITGEKPKIFHRRRTNKLAY